MNMEKEGVELEAVLLLQGIYGLVQSARVWFYTLTRDLIDKLNLFYVLLIHVFFIGSIKMALLFFASMWMIVVLLERSIS